MTPTPEQQRLIDIGKRGAIEFHGSQPNDPLPAIITQALNPTSTKETTK